MTNKESLSTINWSLDTTESRHIEKILFSKYFCQAPVITSRICNRSSFAHNITSNKAIENACKITVSSQTEKLRELMLMAEIIKNHTALLYCNILPSFIGADSFDDLSSDHANFSQDAIYLNNFANNILKAVGGRTIHPITSIPGGFTAFPDILELRQIQDKSDNIRKITLNTIRLFSSFEYSIMQRKATYLALHERGNYAIYDGDVWASNGYYFTTEKLKDNLLEKRYPEFDAKMIFLHSQSVITGPLSRLLINKIPGETGKIVSDLSLKFTFQNPFETILAVAVENHIFVAKALQIISGLIEEGVGKEIIKLPKEFGIGASACESAEGTIFHRYELDKEGMIKKAEIITPSNINLESLRNDMEIVLKQEKEADPEEKEKIKRLLLSSYSFCPTCAKL